MKTNNNLFKLTGLPPEQLADTLISNPRAYMALKGAVAEKHLQNMLERFVDEKKIHSFRKGLGDFEKDFYIKRSAKDREISLECKNVQVINLSNHELRHAYLKFLVNKKYMEELKIALDLVDSKKSNELLKSLPIDLRESGLARYSFSRFLANIEKPIKTKEEENYLKKFDRNPISIDFQRTRNSRDITEGIDNMSARFYRSDEIDLVGACLFSRTLEWDFVFCESGYFDPHKKHDKCFSNSLILNPKNWKVNLADVLKKIR